MQISDIQVMFEELLFSSSRYLIESFELRLFLKQLKFSATNRGLLLREKNKQKQQMNSQGHSLPLIL